MLSVVAEICCSSRRMLDFGWISTEQKLREAFGGKERRERTEEMGGLSMPWVRMYCLPSVSTVKLRGRSGITPDDPREWAAQIPPPLARQGVGIHAYMLCNQ